MTQRFIENAEEQEVSFNLNGETFLFRFYAFRDLMYMDLRHNDEYVAAGKRVMANQWLLPSYVAEGVGNFRFETYKADGDDYVWWEGFNVKFRLVSYTADEIAELESEEDS